jgi:hypothetical protein
VCVRESLLVTDRKNTKKRRRRGRYERGICLYESRTTILSTTLPLAQPFTSQLVYPHTQGYITLLPSCHWTLLHPPAMQNIASRCRRKARMILLLQGYVNVTVDISIAGTSIILSIILYSMYREPKGWSGADQRDNSGRLKNYPELVCAIQEVLWIPNRNAGAPECEIDASLLTTESARDLRI